jgi:hypothetical protein
MAIKTSCPHCKKGFSAPEEYRGRKTECPACHRRFVLRSEEDIQAVEEEALEERRKREEDREKLALIERMGSKGHRRAGRPYYEEFQTGVDGVRHFNPKAPSRFLRVRALSDVLILGAYVEILLVALGVGLMIYLRLSGLIASVSVFLVLVIGWLVAGIALFLFFKCLGELAFLLAEVGDQQNDVVQLLLDIRDNTTPTERAPE